MAMVNNYFFSLNQQCTSGLVVRMQDFMPVVLGSIPTCDAVFCLRILIFASFLMQVFFSAAAGAPGRRPLPMPAPRPCAPRPLYTGAILIGVIILRSDFFYES